MKIYLINLERSIDRRSHMLSELAKFLPKIPIERALCRDIKNTDWSMPEDIQPGHWKMEYFTSVFYDFYVYLFRVQPKYRRVGYFKRL